jgi:phosphatidylinositol glycan class O
MKRSNKKLALLGDETWSYMFPSQFDFKFTSESFDVRDLDSDDNIVINNMFNLIDDNYDFIVGHLLGIDHSGHSYNDSN